MIEQGWENTALLCPTVLNSSVEINSIFNSASKQENLKKQDYFMKLREEEIKCARI